MSDPVDYVPFETTVSSPAEAGGASARNNASAPARLP